MSYKEFSRRDYGGDLGEKSVGTEKIDLEVARQSWQRVHKIMCSSRPKLEEADVEEVVNHLAICISFLEDVKGTGGGDSPESIQDEMTQGVYAEEFKEFIATRNELFDPEISPSNDKMPCDLCVSPTVRIRFTFLKTTDRDGFVTLGYDTELIHPYWGFYRVAWEQMQEKLTSLQNKTF